MMQFMQPGFVIVVVRATLHACTGMCSGGIESVHMSMYVCVLAGWYHQPKSARDDLMNRYCVWCCELSLVCVWCELPMVLCVVL